MGCSEGESGVSVENTKLLSGGEQMSDCRCACIFRSNTLALGRRVSGHLVAVGGEKKRARSGNCVTFFFLPWQQIDLNFKARPTSNRQS